MDHQGQGSQTTNRPTLYILGAVLLLLILAAIFWFLMREGKHPSNPTDGHTSLVTHSVAA